MNGSVLEPLESGLGKGTRQHVWKQVSEDDLTSNMGLWWRCFQDESLPNMPTPESLDPEKILCSKKSTLMKAQADHMVFKHRGTSGINREDGRYEKDMVDHCWF